MLVNLRYLDISRIRIERLPKGTLGALLNLQCLGAGLVNGEEIIKLWALESLRCFFDDVDDFNKFVRVFSKRRNNPPYYEISVHHENFAPSSPRGVDFLIHYCERSVHIMARSHAIVSARGESSGSGSGICILIPQDVWNLTAWFCDGMTNLSNMGPLEKLERLDIRWWSNLQVLCGGQDEELIDIHDSLAQTPTPLLFTSLRYLEINECPKLKYLFGHEPRFSLPHLQYIQICRCVEMVGMIVAATSPLPYQPPAFPSLEEIRVGWCDKMKRVVEFEWLPHFPNLRRLTVWDSENMEEIIGGLSSYMSVEETPINNTPSSSQSSISLPKLNSLYLYNLPQLKSICEVPITCNSMKYLEVVRCPKLNRIPLELQLRDIEDLPYIEVEGEEKWKTLIWDHPNAQAIIQSHLLFKSSCCILKGWRNSRELLI
ncbi:putative disease resistance protein At3g14460 [Eucalyptus grandis]|uniref:putative disease resistance protein At3g14460 n=1 Tax=Eucalyptus grandis TaxID=71139 RepID=UPI00192F01F9|nr:putative disease resistance protein At3g14460 [Eucalyptus grandis]